MLKNYFTIALRNFRKHKIFSFINISGLAIGISAALVIYLVVQYEFSFDKFHKDEERIYRVVSDMIFPGDEVFKNSGVEMPLAAVVRNETTGIELATHFITAWETQVTVPLAGSKSPAQFKRQEDIVYADEFYFQLFKYEWLAGSEQAAVKDAYQVVLTDDRAKQYFGNMVYQDIIGRQITYSDTITCTVSGIVKSLNNKITDLRFKEFVSMATMMQTGLKDNFGGMEWGSINSASQLFLKLKKDVRPEQLIPQFAAIRNKYRDNKEDGKDDTKHLMQPLADIHFNSDYDNFDGRQAHKPTLYGLLAVAVFLLLLGCINFINLTTAQASERAKEIGIRKTLGSSKRELTFQFLSETFLLTAVATILSIVIAPWLLKVFKDFIPPGVSFASINQTHVWIFLSGLVLLMTLFSGFYPALILTKFQPVTAMKNRVSATSAQSRRAWLRKTLTVTQFVIAQFLVIATLVVGKQVKYSLSKDLGYKKDAIVYFRTPWNFHEDKKDLRRFALLEKLKAIPTIENISLGSNSPAHQGASSSTMKLNNGKNVEELMVETINADPDYFSIYNLKLKAGRYPELSDTTKEYLINETYAKVSGFTKPEDAIGKYFERRNGRYPIVGVLADFHAKSTHEPIKPLVYSSQRNSSFIIHATLRPESGSPGLWKTTLDKIENEFKILYPDAELKINFFDETIAAFYKKEQDIKRLLNWSAGLCIFISCLGLLGLVIYTTNIRTKEIGVRKVLGASVLQLVSLLSKDLISLVMIAFIIAAPLAWIAMNNWLQDFAYRTNISWWVFAVCAVSMLLIAIIILGIRTVRAAVANPVKSLRTE